MDTHNPQKSCGITGKDGRKMHVNSLANLEKGKFQPSDARINRNGRPPIDNSWAEICRKVSTELVSSENGDEISRRELFIRQCWGVIDDSETDFRLKFEIFRELSSREEGRPKMSAEIEAKGLAQNVIFLPAKEDRQPPENAKFEIVDSEESRGRV